MVQETGEHVSGSTQNGAAPAADADVNGVEPPQTDAAEAMDVQQRSALNYDPRDDLPAFKQYIVRHSLAGHTRAVASVKFAPANCLLASASADGTAKIWNADTGQQLRSLEGHSKVGAVAGTVWQFGW